MLGIIYSIHCLPCQALYSPVVTSIPAQYPTAVLCLPVVTLVNKSNNCSSYGPGKKIPSTDAGEFTTYLGIVRLKSLQPRGTRERQTRITLLPCLSPILSVITFVIAFGVRCDFKWCHVC